MTRVYRILRKPYSKKPLSGEGAYLFGGRWSSPGIHLAYTAEHLSLAMIEYFIHIDPEDPPQDLVLVTADVPDNVSRALFPAKHLPSNWRKSPPPPGTGRHWRPVRPRLPHGHSDCAVGAGSG